MICQYCYNLIYPPTIHLTHFQLAFKLRGVKMRYRYMLEKQLLVYGARVRLAWFRKAEELGGVSAACSYYGIPRRTYYYWHSRWLASGKQLTSLYELPKTPKSHKRDLDEETVGLIVQLRLGLGYDEDADVRAGARLRCDGVSPRRRQCPKAGRAARPTSTAASSGHMVSTRTPTIV